MLWKASVTLLFVLFHPPHYSVMIYDSFVLIFPSRSSGQYCFYNSQFFFLAAYCVFSRHINTSISNISIKIMVGTFVSTIIISLHSCGVRGFYMFLHNFA